MVTLDGKPLSGAVISQSGDWSWTQEEFTQEAKTDSEGGFILPPIIAHTILASVLPAQIIILQTIRIEYGGTTYNGFMYEKTNYDKFSELGGTSFNLVCELSNKKDYIGDDSPRDKMVFLYNKDTAYGVCRVVPSPFLTKE